MGARKAMLAGSWYPGSASECRRDIDAYLSEMHAPKDTDQSFIGGIVPHAGWYFSGSIACNVIHSLKTDPPPDVVVVFGMHLHPNSPNYIMKEGAWETPFGEIDIADALADALCQRFSFNIETEYQHTQDNTIEVQLPFIKYFFKDAKLLPIGVPPHRNSLDIGNAVVQLAQDQNLRILVIGSTDLTHYGSNYGYFPKGSGEEALNWVTQENDANVISAMLEMDPERVIEQGLSNRNACCAGAAATAITTVKGLGAANAKTVKYATSYEKSPGDSFVGYVGIVFG
jgi:AmmeMemoRadiSam system protein B